MSKTRRAREMRSFGGSTGASRSEATGRFVVPRTGGYSGGTTSSGSPSRIPRPATDNSAFSGGSERRGGR